VEANRIYECPALGGLQTNETCLFVSADNLKLVNGKVVAIKGHRVGGRDRCSP